MATWLCVVYRISEFLTPFFCLQEWGKWNVQIEVEYNVEVKQLFKFSFFSQTSNFLPSFLIFISKVLKIGKCLNVKTRNC